MKKQTKEYTRESENFMSGVLILSLSTVIVKIIGLAYKIPMIAYLGAEGMGYFNSAYEIYALLCVISTAGLPVALSMLISQSRQRNDWEGTGRIYRSALAIFLTLGTLGSLLMLFFAKRISVLIGNESAFLCILAIAPSLFFVCFSSAVRGYFQGFNKMLPTAVSQLIEALGKLIFGVWFAASALKRGMELPSVAAFAILGLSLGTFLSAVYLLLVKAAERRMGVQSRSHGSVANGSVWKNDFSTLLRIAVPITLSSAVLSVTRLIDMALILHRLQDAGTSVAKANEIYGSYTTLAVPVFSLIPSLITPISLTLVPQMAAAIEKKSGESQAAIVDRSVRLTVLLAMPASMGIAVYATPILSILFADELDAIQIAAPLLSLLGVSILFSGLITTTNGILQSYRQTGKPILSMAVGAIVKTVTAYFLIGIPRIGVYGAPISTFLCNLTVTVLNFYYLGKCIPKSETAEGMLCVYWKPLGAAFLSILASLTVYLPIRHSQWGSEALAFCTAFCAAAVAYSAFAVLFRIVTAEDLVLLPFGKRLVRFWHGRSKNSSNTNTQKTNNKREYSK